MKAKEISTGQVVRVEVKGSVEHGFYGYVDSIQTGAIIVRFYPGSDDDAKSFIKSYRPTDLEEDGMWDEGQEIVTLRNQYEWLEDMFAENYGGLPAEQELSELMDEERYVEALQFILEAERWGMSFIERINACKEAN